MVNPIQKLPGHHECGEAGIEDNGEERMVLCTLLLRGNRVSWQSFKWLSFAEADMGFMIGGVILFLDTSM